MANLKQYASAVGIALLGLMIVSSTASAAGETITLQTVVKPLGGKLYKEVRVPASTSVSVQVHTPPSSPTVSPLKRAVMRFPTDLTYNPNNRKTPVCSDRALNEQSNLAAGIAAIVDLCPRSVVGTGSAQIYLAKIHTPGALISDPQMVIFNGGRDARGNARMKIYAYSKATNSGILMAGSLTRKGIQNVAIPVLSNDSATANFVLRIPGPPMTVEDPGAPGGTRVVKGLDPAYARTRCSTGSWLNRGTFTLGERNYPAGTDSGPETIVEATPYRDACKGLPGRARLSNAKAKGPRFLRRGTRRVFRVTVRNRGTATARGVRVRVFGAARGQARTAKIAPGKWRTMKVRVRVTGRKGRPGRIVFRVNGKGTSTRTATRVRIARR